MHPKLSLLILALALWFLLYNLGFVEATKLHSHRYLTTANEDENGDQGLFQIERSLSAARGKIKRAAMSRDKNNNSAFIQNELGVSTSRIYRNSAAFLESYKQMEKRFKVYVYQEGDPPVVHLGPCKNIYSIEGWFIEQIEMLRPHMSGVRTWDPHQAHTFFLPISFVYMKKYIYDILSHDKSRLVRTFRDYVQVVINKYPFWNGTAGADHFMLAAHDWGLYISKEIPEFYSNSIRALCNANTSEGFIPSKDVSIPRINLYTGSMPVQLMASTLPGIRDRTLLAFFSGGRHEPIRPILFEHWKDRDLGLFPVYEYLPKGLDYFHSCCGLDFVSAPAEFCVNFPNNRYEVSSPRIAEAIWAECVPVIISEGYALPFSDVLQWNEFSILMTVADIPNLKDLLMAVPEAEIERLREGVKAVQKHFMINQPPQRFDVFTMILHSVWLRRLNLRLK